MRIRDAYTKLDPQIRPEAAGASKGRDAAGRPTSGAAEPRAGASVATTVTVSARARELSATADQSVARIDALRDRIQRGAFVVDAQAIAARLVGGDE
jgi:flagellar biosynthesis anti-sigma factor FlgM